MDSTERLMSLADLSEMLGIPINTLYRWRVRGEGPTGYRVGRHVRASAARRSMPGWKLRPTSTWSDAEPTMAPIADFGSRHSCRGSAQTGWCSNKTKVDRTA